MSLDLLGYTDGMLVINDNTLTLDLSRLQQPSIVYFNASVPSTLSLYYQVDSTPYRTSNLTLFYAPLTGPPIITRVSATDRAPPSSLSGCLNVNYSGNYTDCYPKATDLLVFGPNLFNGVVTIHHHAVGYVA